MWVLNKCLLSSRETLIHRNHLQRSGKDIQINMKPYMLFEELRCSSEVLLETYIQAEHQPSQIQAKILVTKNSC